MSRISQSGSRRLGLAVLAFSLATVFVPARPAYAQDEGGDESAGASAGASEGGREGEAGIIYRKKTVVSFDDDTIDGDLTRPDGVYVESRKRVRHSNLIRIRENFREKILYSVSGI